jgi:gluconolactonase
MSINVLADHLDFPEGPAFDSSGALWCVELHGGNLVRWHDGALERFPTGGTPNGITIDAQDRIWFCDAGQNAIRRFSPEVGAWETLTDAVDGQPLNMPNDLAFDARGNLVFTCPGDSRQEPTGYVCCLTADGVTEKIADNLYFPNGLAFVDDGSTLIIAETYRQRLWRGVWDSHARRWSEVRVWAEVGGNPGPDGFALGRDRRLYVAVFGAGQIKVIAPSGEIVQLIDLPGMRPTNAAFDPSGKLGLVVTEAEKGLLLSLPELGPGSPLYDGS